MIDWDLLASVYLFGFTTVLLTGLFMAAGSDEPSQESMSSIYSLMQRSNPFEDPLKGFLRVVLILALVWPLLPIMVASGKNR